MGMEENNRALQDRIREICSFAWVWGPSTEKNRSDTLLSLNGNVIGESGALVDVQV